MKNRESPESTTEVGISAFLDRQFPISQIMRTGNNNDSITIINNNNNNNNNNIYDNNRSNWPFLDVVTMEVYHE